MVVQGQQVLELGCGTGLVGLMCAQAGGAAGVVLSDYHPSVLQCATHNAAANDCTPLCQVVALDWLHYELSDAMQLGPFDVVVAADVLYEMAHAMAIPKVVNAFLRRHGKTNEDTEHNNDNNNLTPRRVPTFYAVMPLREKYMKEVETFERGMKEEGFECIYERVYDYNKFEFDVQQQQLKTDKVVKEEQEEEEEQSAVPKQKYYVYVRAPIH